MKGAEAAPQERPGGAGAAVVAVGDVRTGYIGEGRNHPIRIGNPPHLVPHASLTLTGQERRRFDHAGEKLIDCRNIFVRHQHRPRLGAKRQHVARTIILFVAASQLVLLDESAFVLVDAATRQQTHLGLSIDSHSVGIERGFVLPHHLAA